MSESPARAGLLIILHQEVKSMSNKVSSLRILNYGKIKAICDIVIADAVVVHGVRVVEGKDGLFVSFPCERKVDWEGVVRHYDIVHPITAEVRAGLTETVLGEYRRQLEGSNENQAQEK